MFADLVVLLGMPKSMGEIYGLVFASAEPPTFAEIEHKLGLSKGSVSQGLRALRELGAVRDAGQQPGEEDRGQMRSRSEEPGKERKAEATRATRWVATIELRQLIGTLLRERLTPYLERQDQRMGVAQAALRGEEGTLGVAAYKVLQGRLSKLQTWQSRARAVLPLIGKML